jgi:hypothetical protein
VSESYPLSREKTHAQLAFVALADDAPPAGVMRSSLKRQQYGRTGLQAGPGQRRPAALGERQDETPAQAGGFVARDEAQ